MLQPRIFVPFFIASLLLTLTWGATLGMVNLARLTTNWGLGTLPRSSVYAHAYVQVFGFMALFVMGVAYHVLPRFVSGTLQRARLVPWSFWLQLGGVVAIACGFFHGGSLNRPLWIAGSAALLVASSSFTFVIVSTLASGIPGREPFRRWVVAGSGWLVLSSALALTAALTDNVAWHRPLWSAALSGFASSWIFGVGRRILPIFLGCEPRWLSAELWIFGAYQAGTVLWVSGIAPGVGGAFMIGSVIAYTAGLGLFGRIGPAMGCALRSPQQGWEKYVFGAWFWLFVSLALGPGVTLMGVVVGRFESLLLLDVARHALALGFATQMVLGVASRVVPNFTGKPLWSPQARDIAFYLLNGSMAIRALEVPIGMGFWVGMWPHLAWAGPLGVLAMVLFAANIIMTVRQRPSPLLHPMVLVQQ